MNLDMTMFHQTFFEEAADLLNDLEGLLLRLEETPEDLELLNTIFRCAHSIKGGSATFGFSDVAHFTHSLETLLDKVRNGQIRVDGALSQLLLESLDQLKSLLAVARGEAASAPDSTPLIARLEAATAGHTAYAVPAAAEQTGSSPETSSDDGQWGVFALPRMFHLRFVPGPDVPRQGIDPAHLLAQLERAGEVLSITCDPSRLPALTELDPEASYLGWEVELRSEQTREELLEIFEFIADESEVVLTETTEAMPEAQAVPETQGTDAAQSAEAPLRLETYSADAPPRAEGTGQVAASGAAANPLPKTDTHTLRVSADKVDKLINLVGELVINQSMLNEVIQNFSMAKLPRLMEAVAEMERASRELQERVMAVRMLPIKHAFGRFPRLVRDLASACGKKIELKTSGEETELDKTVIEAIADPLTHLVRNSIDHGLETPEERREVGKPETGNVALHAFHEGGSIVVEITDDGRGLNREKIQRKAIARGLLAEGDSPPDDVLYNLIFHPGFSTADQVTDLSGRGVGMDIVKQGIRALGGTIQLSSTPGQGTCFRIRLPLTMAILEGQSLLVGNEVYILPLTSIVESIQPKQEDVRLVAGQAEVVVVRGEVLPILRLYEVFGAAPNMTDPARSLLVIVENDGHKVALLVDELIGQNQVVIKSLEANYRKVDGIAGATILGDGRVALIVDVPGLIRGANSSGALYAQAA
jgi:two-component system, chemotaxis family, sensor kinase CheA